MPDIAPSTSRSTSASDPDVVPDRADPRAGYRARRDAIAALARRAGGQLVDVDYLPEEHATWRTVLAALAPLHDRAVCAPLRRMAARLALPSDRIPQLSEVSAALGARTGFALRAVAGLVPPRRFFPPLARGVFLCTQYVRDASTPHFTPEPDVIHELVGHAATLADPSLAALNRAFGRAAARADPAGLVAVERLYWFSLEFGAVWEDGTVKAVGAGLLSSVAELAGLASHPNLRPWDPATIVAAGYETQRAQPVLYVAESFEALCASLDEALGRLSG